MRLTKSTEYAIRTLFKLKFEEPDQFIALKDLAGDLTIPYHQLAKVAQKLVAANILVSLTGPKGGVHLSRRPEDIALMDIVLSTEGTAFTERCLLGLEECSGDNPCPVHQYWAPVREAMEELFRSKSLADMISPNEINPPAPAGKKAVK